MLNDYLTRIYNEIISKKEWEEKYSSRVKIPQKTYAKTLPLLQEIFTRLNGGTYANTVIFDYEGSVSRVRINKELMEFLNRNGYSVNDKMYKLGFAEKDGKQLPIAQIVDNYNNKLRNVEKMKEALKNIEAANKPEDAQKKEAIKKNIDALDFFANIHIQESNLNKAAGAYKIVITMDPRAIASQSTNVGWRSCMNLKDGMYKRYVGSGIGAGVFIAYLTRVGDEKELKNPTARVLIKPLIGAVHKRIYWTVDAIYGEAPATFRRQVQKIINRVNEKVGDIYTLSDKVYDDSQTVAFKMNLKTTKGLTNKQLVALMNHKPEMYKDIENPSEEVTMEALRGNGMMLEYVKNPTSDMIETALRHNGEAIKFLDKPKKEYQLQAVRSDPDALKYINTPSEQVQYEAVKYDPRAFKYIPDPSPRIILKAIQNDGEIIKQINNPTKQMMKAAIDDSVSYLRYIDNPPEDIQMYAIRQDEEAIEYIKKPKRKIVEYAIMQDANVIEYIKNPPEWLQIMAIRAGGGDVIRNIKHPTERVMMMSLRDDIDNDYWLERKMTPRVRAYVRRVRRREREEAMREEARYRF